MSAQPSKLPASFRPIEIRLKQDHSLDLHSLIICLGVSRRALSHTKSTPSKANQPEGTSPILHLELRFDKQLKSYWSLVDPISKNCVDLEIDNEQPAVITHLDSMIHLGSPILSCYIQITANQVPTLVYFRSTILSQLNLAGGRYEPIGCRVDQESDS